MRRRGVLAALMCGIGACSVVPGLADSRSYDFLVTNRSARVIDVNTGAGPEDFAAVVEPCSSLVWNDADVRMGDALVIDGEVVWTFDHLPPPDMQAVEVEVRADGMSATLIEQLPAGGPPAFACGEGR